MVKARLLALWVEHERRSAMYHSLSCDTSAVSVEGCREGVVCEELKIYFAFIWSKNIIYLLF